MAPSSRTKLPAGSTREPNKNFDGTLTYTYAKAVEYINKDLEDDFDGLRASEKQLRQLKRQGHLDVLKRKKGANVLIKRDQVFKFKNRVEDKEWAAYLKSCERKRGPNKGSKHKPRIGVSIASLVFRDDGRLRAASTSPEPIPFAIRLHGDYEWTLLDLDEGVLETWWDFEGDGTETPIEDSEDVDWLISEGYGVVSEEVLKGSHPLYPVASKLKSGEHRP